VLLAELFVEVWENVGKGKIKFMMVGWVSRVTLSRNGGSSEFIDTAVR